MSDIIKEIEIVEPKYFITDNFSLTAFLELNGLRYVKAELTKGKNGRIVVMFWFLDPDNKGRDLEVDFRFSNEKRYRDCLFLYKRIITEMLGK
jgi:hypothetical protein